MAGAENGQILLTAVNFKLDKHEAVYGVERRGSP